LFDMYPDRQFHFHPIPDAGGAYVSCLASARFG
jgi:hypothetical protein